MDPVSIIEENIIPQKTETISSPMQNPSEPELQESQIIEPSESQPTRNELEEHLFRNDERQDLSPRSKIQTSLSTSNPEVLSKENLQERQLNTIIAALEKAGLNDDYIMSVIKEGIESAVFQGPKGAVLRDRPSIIKLVDKYLKLKKYYKSDTIINVLNAFANPGQLY